MTDPQKPRKRRPKPGAPGKPLYRAPEPSVVLPAPPDSTSRASDPFQGFTFPDRIAESAESAYRADVTRTQEQVDSIMRWDRERQERERAEQAGRRRDWLIWLAAQWQKFKRKVTHPQ
jgi:hypothetical protein